MFRGSLPRNFLMILALLLLVLWIATKFTFITITLEEDNIALHGKNNMQHLHTPTWNWYTYWDNIRRHHCTMWEKIISIICIYLPETNILIGIRMLSTAHYREFSYVQGNLHYYPGISYQLLYTNQYFLITTLVLSHIYTHITEGSFFISELLPLKTGVWLSQ